MKITLYAEENNGRLFALPSENTEDTVRNGWFFTQFSGCSGSFHGEILDAVCENDGLFVVPKAFGNEMLSLTGMDLEIEILPVADSEKYRYKNLPISGGGYVTGFAYDEDGWLFCRTDIGGCYSCGPGRKRWTALSHNADAATEWLCSPLALTCKNGRFYVLFGNRLGSFLGVSDNKGRSFEFYPVPADVHGNCAGRSTGERIAVSSGKIFIGTRGGGILCADETVKPFSWEKLTLSQETGSTLRIFRNRENPCAEIAAKDDITLICANGDIIAAGTAESSGVYISYDGGNSFLPLPNQPASSPDGLPFISQRCAVYDNYLYITYSCSASDRSSVWYSYSCDGGKIIDGKVLRYQLKNGRYEFSADITPQHEKCGFSGIDVSSDGEFLVCTTVCGVPDCIFLSRDHGESWEELLADRCRSRQIFRTPYMKSENNNGQSVIHWMSDIKLDPADRRSVYINTGTGVFCTHSLGERTTVWEDFSDGIEETVHLNIYSPPAGKVRVIDAVGDLGGFAFTELDKECGFTFRDENHNRYITAINADFAENRPEIAVISPRGNWLGTSKGGAAVSFDGGVNWKQLSDPYGLNERSDALLEKILRPNVNPGWVSVSCDGEAVIRQIADGRALPSESVAVTFNFGEVWTQSEFFSRDDRNITGNSLCVKVFSDRCLSDSFYAFGSCGEVFVSRDKGLSFKQCYIDGYLPCSDLSSIEGHNSPDIRVSPFSGGEILLCSERHGIFLLKISGSNVLSERIIPAEDCSCALCGGFGKGGVIFFCGIYRGVYGFWRSFNDSWIRINTDKTQFGQIRSICGDPRAYGRFYIATGSFGALYGEIDTEKPPV